MRIDEWSEPGRIVVRGDNGNVLFRVVDDNDARLNLRDALASVVDKVRIDRLIKEFASQIEGLDEDSLSQLQTFKAAFVEFRSWFSAAVNN